MKEKEKYHGEPLFDYIVIRETGETSDEGYKTGELFGVNYDEPDKEIPCGYIDCFTVSESCQFDFNKNGGISVFCKSHSNNPNSGKVFARETLTGMIIAFKDCEH